MHHALEIPEILLNIFGHCTPVLSTRDLSILARTCRTFKEPALDVLWEELNTLSPLAKCLPEVLYPEDKYSFSKQLTQTDWDVLRSYTHRIRSIQNFQSGLSRKSFRILSNPPTAEPLFPNLRSLQCKYTTKAMPLLHLPLPSLISFHVEMENVSTFQNHFKSFPNFSPSLQRFYIHIRQPGGRNIFGTDYVVRWRNLQCVVCPEISLDGDTLVHLSGMPSLIVLTFMPSATLPDQIALTGSFLLFTNLLALTLRSEFLDPISRLLSRVRLPAITSLIAIIGNCPSRQDLTFFVASIKLCCTGHTIQRLVLTQSMPLSNAVHRQDDLLLGLEDLWPCMEFRNLHHVELDIGWDVGLRDSELLMLASAWPRLEHLAINVRRGWNTRGGITPNGLLQLLRMCRSLSEIAIALDTRGFTEFVESPESLGLTLPSTFSIDVLDSLIDEESMQAVTAFFASIAPSSGFTFSAWDGWSSM